MSNELESLIVAGGTLLFIVAVWIVVVIVWLRQRRRATAAYTETAATGFDIVIRQHETALFSGQLELAVALGRKAVDFTEVAGLGPAQRLKAHYVLSRALSRVGRDDEAITHLHVMRELLAGDGGAATPSFQALAQASTSSVLRRLGRLDEALEVAELAVRHETAGVGFDAAGPGSGQIALALAQTDSGEDGRAAARKGLEIFRRLHDTGALTEGESLAYACYAMAYAARPHGDDVSAWAREAVQRYTALDAATPGLYERRLADAVALAEEQRLG